MDSFSAIIEAAGIRKFSEMLGVAESHVRVMKARNSVPPEHWGAIIQEFPDLTHASLKAIRDRRFGMSRSSADAVSV